jgi:sugar phosphate isomerase/epimerase
VQVVVLCRTPYLVGTEAPRGDDDLRASNDMAADLGAPVLTIVTGGTEPGTKGVIETQKRLADRVALAAPLAAAAGVALALEPLNPMFGGNRTCLITVADALAVADAVGAPNVGIAVDIYTSGGTGPWRKASPPRGAGCLVTICATGSNTPATCCWTAA